MLIYLSLISSKEEQKTFSRIYNSYRYRMFYLALQILNDKMLAEDAVHDAFVKVIEIMDYIISIEEKRAYNLIMTITRNKAIDIKRAKMAHRETDLDDSAKQFEDISAMQIMDEINSEEGYQRLLACIGNLSDRYRDIFTLRYVDGYSIEEIAKFLNLQPKQVHQYIFRARQNLKKMLMEKRRGRNERKN